MRIPTSTISTVLALCCAMSVVAQTGGSISPIPNSCPASALSCSGSPVPGGTLQWSTAPNLAGPAFLVFGFGNQAWNGAAVPQLLDPIAPSLVGCSQLAAADVAVMMWLGFSGNPWGIPIHYWFMGATLPSSQAYSGTSFSTQVLYFDSSFSPLVTDGCAITIG